MTVSIPPMNGTKEGATYLLVLGAFLLNRLVIAVLLVTRPNPISGLVSMQTSRGPGLLRFCLVDFNLWVGRGVDQNSLEVFLVLCLVLEKCMF